MADIQSVEFAINLFVQIDVFSLQTRKGKTLFFKKKSAIIIVR